MERALGAPSFGEEHLLAVYHLPSLSTLWPGGGIPRPSLGSLQWPCEGSQCPRASWCWSGSSKRAETWREDFSHRSLSETEGNILRCAVWPVSELSSAFAQNRTFFDFVYPVFQLCVYLCSSNYSCLCTYQNNSLFSCSAGCAWKTSNLGEATLQFSL